MVLISSVSSKPHPIWLIVNRSLYTQHICIQQVYVGYVWEKTCVKLPGIWWTREPRLIAKSPNPRLECWLSLGTPIRCPLNVTVASHSISISIPVLCVWVRAYGVCVCVCCSSITAWLEQQSCVCHIWCGEKIMKETLEVSACRPRVLKTTQTCGPE